jgi:hypothetical protein
MSRPGYILLCFFVFSFTASIATPVYAYLDPGTGSMILQGIIAGIAMISMTFKIWWYKLTSVFKKPKKTDQEIDEPPESAENK